MYLLNRKMKIVFPEGYQRLTNERIGALFPGRQKPQMVIEGEDGDYTAFYLTDKAADSSQLNSARDDFCFMLRQRYPADIFFEQGELKTESGILSWADFQGDTFSEKRYYLLFLTAIGEKLLMGLFQCDWRKMGIHKERILQILRGITDISKDA